MNQDLQTLDQAANRVLFRASTVFPFTLFPDVLEVTDSEVKIITGIFFSSKEVSHIPLKELHNVKLTTSFFFSQLSFEIKGYEKNPETIKFLSREDGVEAEELISGLILCSLQNIDTLQYPKDELIRYVKSMGRPVTATV